MVSIPHDFSKVEFIDKHKVNFCADKKVQNESISEFSDEISNTEKIISLEKTPDKDIFETKLKKGLFKEIQFVEDYKKENKLTRKNLSTTNLKNDNGTDVDIKENIWGTRSFNGRIEDKDVSLKCNTQFFKKNKGTITGTINGKEVELTYKYDDKKGMIIEGLDDKNQNVGNTIADYAKFITTQRTLILAMSLPGVLAQHSSNDALIQQNFINEQIRLQNELVNQQMMGMM